VAAPQTHGKQRLHLRYRKRSSGRYPLVGVATANPILVYGLLTALIAGVYAGAVLVPEQVFGGMRGDPPTWMRSPPTDPTTGIVANAR
jgi:hypothetical protein